MLVLGRRLAELEMHSMLAHVRKKQPFYPKHTVFDSLPVTACAVQVIPRFKMSTRQILLKVKTESTLSLLSKFKYSSQSESDELLI